MAAIREVDTWNINPTTSRPGRSSCKDEAARDMQVADKDDKFLTNRKDVWRPTLK